MERFHRVLVDEIARRRPDYLRRPFTVAEIYQTLVPYRSHREVLGVQMNGDYEDALLRLLAGAGELVHLQSEPALGELRRELESRNPNTGLFREFAAAEVRLNPDRLPSDVRARAADTGAMPASNPAFASDAASPESPARTEYHPPLEHQAPREPRATWEYPARRESQAAPEHPAPLELHPPAPPPSGSSPAPAGNGTASDFLEADITPVEPTAQANPTPAPPDPGSAAGSCGWCQGVLPDRTGVNFCPHCGRSARLKPCAACGDEMELGWRYCVRCGADAGTAATG
ncbi:MAG: zinc ribbon domain-containing protein [Gemmatimonadota bacterium]